MPARNHDTRDCIARLTLLNEAAVGFAELTPDADVYRFIAETLHRFVPDSTVLVSSCDDDAGTICARALVGLDSHLNAALKIIGRNPEGMTVPLTDEARTLMSCGRLVELPDGLREVTGRAVSDRTISALRRLLHPGRTYAMGFHWKGRLHGAAAVMLRRGTNLDGVDAIETFMRLAAVALQRHRAELELHRTREELEQRVRERTAELDCSNRELRGALTRFATVINSTPLVAVQGFDSAGVILHWNPACERLYGHPAGKMLGRRIQDILESEDAAREFERELAHVWTTAKPTLPRERAVPTAAGEHWVLSAMFPVLADGAVTEVFRMDVDISVRRQAEQELARHRAHLEELVEERARDLKHAHEELLRRERLAALGRLAGTVAHEIRNPLGAIRNAVYYLNITAARRFEGREARHLEIIQEQIDRANSTITALLEFARGRTPEPTACPVADLIDTALKRVEHPPGIRVVTRIPTDLPPALTDPEQLTRACTNLIANAVDALAGSGTITITAGALDRRVEIRLSDDGPGIDPENLKRVFEPLFTTKAVGVGLGLPLCRALIEANEGTLRIESGEGQGATFVINLPAAARVTPAP